MTQGRTTPSSSSTIPSVYGFIPSCIKSCVARRACFTSPGLHHAIYGDHEHVVLIKAYGSEFT
jgi:hypothetical protein